MLVIVGFVGFSEGGGGDEKGLGRSWVVRREFGKIEGNKISFDFFTNVVYY